MHGRHAGPDTPVSLALGVLALLMLMVLWAPPVWGAGGPRIGIVTGASNTGTPTDMQSRLNNSMLFGQVDVIDAHSSTPAFSTLKGYDGLLVMSDSFGGFSDSKNTDAALAQYLDNGGGVVIAAPGVTNNLTGDFYNRYGLFDSGTFSGASPASLGMTDTTSPIVTGVSSISESSSYCQQHLNLSAAALRNGGKLVASWANGNGMVAFGQPNGRPLVVMNMTIGASNLSYGCIDYNANPDALKLLTNALIYVSNPLRSSPNPVNFGNVGVGVTAQSMNVTITNAGMGSVTLSSGAISPAGEFTLSGATFPAVLGPGATLTLTIGFTPTGSGPRSAALTLAPSGPPPPPLVVPLVGTGIGPTFSANPAMVSFGGIRWMSTPAPVTVQLANVGGGQLQLTALTLNDTTNFALANLPALPNVLSAGASQSVQVQFTPSAQMSFLSSLTVSYYLLPDAMTVHTTDIPLSGAAGLPAISVPPAVTLQSVRVGRASMSQYVTIQNTGLANLTVSGAGFSGGAMGEFVVESPPTMAMPLLVPPGGAQNLRLHYTPAAPGARGATLTLTSDDPATPSATVQVAGYGVVAQYKISAQALDFTATPPTTLGACGVPQNLVITNGGDDVLNITALTFGGPAGSSFRTTTPAPLSAPGGGMLTIPVQLCPQDIGALSGTLVISTDLSPGHMDTVTLAGNAAGPKAVISPAMVNFGSVFINQTKTIPVTITNMGDADLVFTGAPVMPLPPFSASGLPADMTVVKPTASVSFMVSAQPGIPPSMAMGTLVLSSNDLLWPKGITIPLVVNGTQGSLSASTTMMFFAPTSVGARSMSQDLVLTNNGSLPLSGFKVQLTGANPEEFSAPTTSMVPPAMLAPLESFTLKVYFNPMAAGSQQANLAVNAAGLIAPAQVSLTGNGAPVSVSCDPTTLNFNTVPIGSSASQSVICTNTDDSPVDISAMFDDFASDWSVASMAGLTIPGATASAGSLTMSVTFKPTDVGMRTADLQIASRSNGGLVLATIAVNGSGQTASPGAGDGGSGCSAARGPGGVRGAWALALLLLVGRCRRRRSQA